MAPMMYEVGNYYRNHYLKIAFLLKFSIRLRLSTTELISITYKLVKY